VEAEFNRWVKIGVMNPVAHAGFHLFYEALQIVEQQIGNENPPIERARRIPKNTRVEKFSLWF
jgi:hypothetical protein